MKLRCTAASSALTTPDDGSPSSLFIRTQIPDNFEAEPREYQNLPHEHTFRLFAPGLKFTERTGKDTTRLSAVPIASVYRIKAPDILVSRSLGPARSLQEAPERKVKTKPENSSDTDGTNHLCDTLCELLFPALINGFPLLPLPTCIRCLERSLHHLWDSELRIFIYCISEPEFNLRTTLSSMSLSTTQ